MLTHLVSAVSYAGEEVGIASTIGASESEDNWEELSETAYGGECGVYSTVATDFIVLNWSVANK